MIFLTTTKRVYINNLDKYIWLIVNSKFYIFEIIIDDALWVIPVYSFKLCEYYDVGVRTKCKYINNTKYAYALYLNILSWTYFKNV